MVVPMKSESRSGTSTELAGESDRGKASRFTITLCTT